MTFSALLLRNLHETAIMEEHSTGEILDMCSWVTVILKSGFRINCLLFPLKSELCLCHLLRVQKH